MHLGSGAYDGPYFYLKRLRAVLGIRRKCLERTTCSTSLNAEAGMKLFVTPLFIAKFTFVCMAVGFIAAKLIWVWLRWRELLVVAPRVVGRVARDVSSAGPWLVRQVGSM
jgi:hypothetical protein